MRQIVQPGSVGLDVRYYNTDGQSTKVDARIGRFSELEGCIAVHCWGGTNRDLECEGWVDISPTVAGVNLSVQDKLADGGMTRASCVSIDR